MAKHLDNVRIFLTSATTDLDENRVRAEYRVCNDDGLSKNGSWAVSGIDLNSSTVSGFWDAVIAELESIEGIT